MRKDRSCSSPFQHSSCYRCCVGIFCSEPAQQGLVYTFAWLGSFDHAFTAQPVGGTYQLIVLSSHRLAFGLVTWQPWLFYLLRSVIEACSYARRAGVTGTAEPC